MDQYLLNFTDQIYRFKWGKITPDQRWYPRPAAYASQDQDLVVVSLA
jgi:hypothetical protein